MISNFFKLFLLVSFFAVTSLANENLTKVGQIEIKGLKRIEKDAVLAKLVLKVGQNLSQEQVRNDIQNLFQTGWFQDIEVYTDDLGNQQVRVLYELKEHPVISKLEFDGNERVTAEDLKEVIKLKEWAILDVNKVKDDIAHIQKHYEEKGYYLTKVDFEIKPIKEGEVELVYKINDYDRVQIKKIIFLNNKHFSDEQLKSVLAETKEGGAFSFMTGSGNFKDSSFKMDLQRMTYWYLEHGFVKFRYENPVIAVSDDKKWLYITVYIDEGEPYNMGQLDFGGELLFTKEELDKDLVLRPGDVFGISKRNLDIQRLTEKYQDLGYAFTNVIPKMNIHDDTKTVDIQYDFEKGNLIHFGEIVILGNAKTYDKVIRRELKIIEGELYNGTRLRESRENVERLGFFAPGEVIFNTVSPKDKPDILNLEITIKERSTGTITLGAGYSSGQGFFFTTQISEINLLGRGQTLSLALNLTKDHRYKSINLGFTDPYAFDTKWSMGFDTYYISQPIPNKWTTRRLGFDVRLGYPIREFVNAYITYKNEGTKLEDIVNESDPAIQEDLNADRGMLSSVVFSIVRDKRNNRFETSAGNYQSVTAEIVGLGGDKKFLKWIINNRYYTKLIGDLVFRNNLEYGQIHALGGKITPPSERFLMGGANTLKGYPFPTVGPARIRKDANGNSFVEPIGGRIEMLAVFELEYPLVREAGIKLVTFFDAGNAFETFPVGHEFKIKTDAGLGIRWFSPIGPLRFEWGFPIMRDPGDPDMNFEFMIGTPF
ncbi:MAG: outer membrane protein assembly factor BamA [Bdellovibrio sp.]|nr:outer membrane protein assembly factor BamA [Bdellovibrio sp.]